jgi:LytS/YehU family sensor histidine kinase
MVNVAAELADGWLTVSVVNTGAWVSPDRKRSPGSGLQTLRKRLGLLIGQEATVEVDTRQGSVSIRIRLPDTRPPGAANSGATSRPDRPGLVDS